MTTSLLLHLQSINLVFINLVFRLGGYWQCQCGDGRYNATNMDGNHSVSHLFYEGPHDLTTWLYSSHFCFPPQDIQTKELNNGRLAMIAIAGFAAQEEVDHITIWKGLVKENIVPASEANLFQ